MRRLLISLGCIFVALAILLGLGFNRIVDGMLRPWAVAKTAMVLQAEVRLERLELNWGRLELTGVQVTRAGEYLLTVERVLVDYSLAGIWRRQLDSLALQQPELVWEGGQADAEPIAWPAQAPLRVQAWSVTDGRVQISLGKERLLLRQLEASGNLDLSYTVEASALLGNQPDVTLSFAGHGLWEGRPELTIASLLWSGHSLLQTPVTITPGTESFAVSLALARLDDVAAARVLAALERQLPWPPELSWSVAEPRLTVKIDSERLVLLLESTAGALLRQGERWPWENLRLQVTSTSGVWEIDGEVVLPAQARLQVTGIWSDAVLHGRWQLYAPAPGKLGAAFGDNLPLPAEHLRELRLGGDLRFAAGIVTLEKVRLAALLRGGELTGSLSACWQNDAVSVEMADMALRQGANSLATGALKLDGRVAAKTWRGSWQLQVPDALRLVRALAIVVPAAMPNLQGLEVQGEAEGTLGHLSLPQVKVNGRLQRDDLNAKVAMRFAARQLDQGWRCKFEQLTFSELEYLPADGRSGVSGGTLRLAGSMTWQENLDFNLHGEAAAAEALTGSWYADLGGLPLRLEIEGLWTPATNRIDLHSGHFDLAELVTARLRGSVTEGSLDLAGEVAVPRLAGVFQQQLRQLAAAQFPGLEGLEMAGSVAASGAGSWTPQGWEIQATVRPAGVTLGRGDALQLVGLRGELPVLLQRGMVSPGIERPAALQWDELRSGPLSATPGGCRLTARPNHWQLTEPLLLAAGSGWLELNGFELSLAAAGFEMRASLAAREIELSEITRAFGWVEMGGRLGAELSDLHLSGERLSSGGEALLQLFDGTVRVRNMLINKPFSRYPTYHADIEFSGIDLQLLTQAFAFGEMNGVADGSIHKLRLFDRVPSAFRAVIETREQGTRNISVKALRNLNTLSQGGLSAALSQGIYRFIDFYRYRKIGIRCWLQNDVLHLEGTAKPGVKSYLIDGGWLPPRIDVIVSTPTISFQEMLKRLKRLERAER